jgi:large conductance mechanosensitive channel
MFKEFKEFISRGNVIDLAVAVIMGAAFTAIIQALVSDIITPILGIFLGGINFSNLSITIGHAIIKYGSFIQATINFLIIGGVVFLIVQAINKIERHLLQTELTSGKAVSPELKTLMEIRDVLKQGKQ